MATSGAARFALPGLPCVPTATTYGLRHTRSVAAQHPIRAWRAPHVRRPHERRWPATIAVIGVIVLQVTTPAQLTPGWWPVLVAMEAALLVPLVAANPVHLDRDHPMLRTLGLVLAVVLLAANGVRLVELVLAIGQRDAPDAGQLIATGALIGTTNVIATAIGMWELDSGGPHRRAHESYADDRPDLLFPQMTGVPGWDAESWRPCFSDYLFVGFTAATAFSPTDTMPLSVRAKGLMTVSAAVSLGTIAIVAAHAVNIAGTTH